MVKPRNRNNAESSWPTRQDSALGYAGEVFLGDLFLNITGILIIALGITLFAMKTQRYEQAIVEAEPLSFLVCSDFIESRSSGEKIKAADILESHFAEPLLTRNTSSKLPIIFFGERGDTAAFFLSTYLTRHGFPEARIIEGECHVDPMGISE